MKKGMMQLSMHSIKNILGDRIQEDFFNEQHIDCSKEFDIHLNGTIERFGIDLTDVQARVMEALISKFSETSFKGNMSSQSRKEYIDLEYSGKQPPTLKNVSSLPRIRIKQSDLIKALGISRDRGGEWTRAITAFNTLGMKQYCYFYDRLVLDEGGRGVKDASGRWEKEEVSFVDTLFKIAYVNDEKTGKLKYYEVTPSPIFLDQRESYFILVPNNWREELQKTFGTRKSSSYTFRFIIFLMYQFEQKRRLKKRNKTEEFTLEMTPESIAWAIKMPKTVINRNKKRMLSVLESSCEVAKGIGYLSDWKIENGKYFLTLSFQKFLNTNQVSLMPSNYLLDGKQSSLDISKLVCLYQKLLKNIDENWPDLASQEIQRLVKILNLLLHERPITDIENFISWCFSNTYWTSKMLNPSNLKNKKAWVEFKARRVLLTSDEYLNMINLSKQELFKLGAEVDIEISKSEVNIHLKGSMSYIIAFSDKSFEAKFNRIISDIKNVESEKIIKRSLDLKKSREADCLKKKNIKSNVRILSDRKVSYTIKDINDRAMIFDKGIGIYLGLDSVKFAKELDAEINLLESS